MIALLVIGLIAIPLLEVAIGMTGSPELRALSYACWVVFVGAILLVILAPVMLAGWARRLARAVANEQPSGVVGLAILSVPHTPELVVVVADQDGIAVRDRKQVLRFPWVEIARIELRYQGTSDTTVVVTGTEGHASFSFVPLRRWGNAALGAGALEKYLDSIRMQHGQYYRALDV